MAASAFFRSLIFLSCSTAIFAPSLSSSDVEETAKVKEQNVTNESSPDQSESDHDATQNDTKTDETDERGAPASFDFPSKQDQLLVLDMLNNPQYSLRLKAVGAPVYGMRCLSYDENLEQSAYVLASRCSGMRSNGNEKPPGYPDVLEAVSVTEGNVQPTYADALTKMYVEGRMARYDPISGICSLECRNYKAMMYKDNDAVGCSRIRCTEIESVGSRSGFVTVCLFGATTPYDYNRKAYDIGQSCTQQTCPAEKPLCDGGALCCKTAGNYNQNTAATENGQPLTLNGNKPNPNQIRPNNYQMAPTLNQIPGAGFPGGQMQGYPNQYQSGNPGQYPGMYQNQLPGTGTGQFPGMSTGQQFPGMGTGQFPGMSTGQQFPGMSTGQYPGTGMGQGMYPNQATGMYPNQSPGMYPNQAPGTYPNQAPGMYPNQAPGMYPNQAPGMYPNQASGMYPNQAPGMYPNQAPGMYPNQASGMYPNQASGMYPNQAPGMITSQYPGYPNQNPYSYGSPYATMNQYSSVCSTSYPSQYPGMMPNQYPGMMPNQYPGTMPNQYPGTMPNQYPGMMPNQYPGTMPNQYPGTMPNQYPGTMPNQYPGTMPNQYPGTMPNQYPGTMPNQYPGTMPNQYPGTMPNPGYPTSQYQGMGQNQYPGYPGMNPNPYQGTVYPREGNNSSKQIPYGNAYGGDTTSSFCYSGNQMVPRCSPGQFTWSYHTWKIGGMRNYYVPRGRKMSINDCLYDCGMQDDCYFATMTNSGNCYFLTTSSPAACRYFLTGHFGPMGEKCTLTEPCPSAYKICTYPHCSLISMAESHCKDANPQTSLSRCRPGFCTSGFCAIDTRNGQPPTVIT